MTEMLALTITTAPATLTINRMYRSGRAKKNERTWDRNERVEKKRVEGA